MSRSRPEASDVNWLPSPPDRPFGLVFRGYLPKDDLLGGTFRMPRLEAIG